MIQVQGLSKIYGVRAAISDLNFVVNAGEIVGFLGPNGAGKSTTMKILTGFMPASEGKATVAGFDVFTQPIEVKRNIGYLPETPPVYMDMQVRDYLTFAARLHEVASNRLKPAVDMSMEKTGLTQVAGRLIGNLSKGFRQRVGLAQALVHSPKVLILDEPTVGLDPVQIIEIRELIKGLRGAHTVILSSHILPEVTATCERIIVINQGRIVAQDTLERLTSRMRKGVTYTLAVKKGGEAARKTLAAVSGVGAVSETGPGKFSIEFSEKSESANEFARIALVEAAVRDGLGVTEFSSEKLSLEDVFLQLTTKEEANS